jgi:hypothetical protein
MLLWALSTVAAPIAGAICHEATHALTAKALGGEVESYSVRELYLEASLPGGPAGWRSRLTGLSPQILGWGAALVWLLAGQPSLFLDHRVILFWVVFTVLGGLSDYSAAVSERRGADA